MLVAIGINEEGYREVIGFRSDDGESYYVRKDFFCGLKSHGPEKVDFIVSDNHGRLVTAIREQFHNAIRQRCQTHFSKNILDKTAKKSRAEIGPQLTDMYNSSSLQEACQRRYNLIGKLKKHLQGSSIA